ncbi:MAG: hypothetical protein ACYCW6_13950 [Candidatus Xenobia bacterium]
MMIVLEGPPDAEALEMITYLEHPNVARVVDSYLDGGQGYCMVEPPEGIELQRLLDGSVSGLPVPQIVGWGKQLCSVLACLSDRPRPCTLDRLTPEDVVVTGDGSLRCLLRPRLQGEGDGDRNFILLGTVLYAMCLEGRMDIPPALDRIIRFCIRHAINPVYRSFEEVAQALDAVLKPASRPARPAVTPAPDPPPPPLDWHTLLLAFLSQPPRWLAAEGLVVCLLLAFWGVPRPHYARHGETAWVMCGDGELCTIDVARGAVVDRRRVGDCLAEAGNRLLVTDRQTRSLMVLNPENNQIVQRWDMPPDPGLLVVSPDQGAAVCLHHDSRNVTFIDLVGMRLTNVVAVADCPVAAAFSPDGQTLYLAEEKRCDVVCMDVSTGRLRRSLKLPAPPTAMQVSPDGGTLWAASSDGVVRCDLVNDTDVEMHLPGADAILFTPDALFAVVLCRDGVRFLKSDGTLVRTVGVAGPPIAGAFAGDGTRLWVTTASGLQRIEVASGAVSDGPPGGNAPHRIEIMP